MLALAVEISGWVGGLILVVAYALVSLGSIAAQGRMIQWLNIAGSALLGVNSVSHHAWPSASINLIWVGVGLFALLRIARLKSARVGSEANSSRYQDGGKRRIASR